MDQNSVDCIILAGGEARRMAGQDKGLLLFNGIPLVQHVLTRIAPQVGQVWISANRNIPHYQQFGHPVITDATSDFLGPLAGVLAGLRAAASEWVLTVPCDTPLLPTDLVARMMAVSVGADVIVAAAARTHATVMLCRRNLVENLADFLVSGERKVQVWQAQQRLTIVHFSDDAAFANINTPAQLG